jgi:hypothetical protein
MSSKGTAAAATTAALSITRSIGADAQAAAYSTGSLVGGLVEFSGKATAASAITGLASFTRGLDSSGNAAGEATGLVGATRSIAAQATAGADASAELTLVASFYRLVMPTIQEKYELPGTNGALTVSNFREVTVFGDESGLATSNLGAIDPPEAADEWGAIPEGTKYIWYGGHVNMTDDPAIRDLWLAHGYEVELVQM